MVWLQVYQVILVVVFFGTVFAFACFRREGGWLDPALSSWGTDGAAVGLLPPRSSLGYLSISERVHE